MQPTSGAGTLILAMHLPRFVTTSLSSSHHSTVSCGADLGHGQKRRERTAYNRAARRDVKRAIAADLILEDLEDEADRREDRDCAYEQEYADALSIDPWRVWSDYQDFLATGKWPQDSYQEMYDEECDDYALDFVAACRDW